MLSLGRDRAALAVAGLADEGPGEVIGSVSGGCVEGAVYELAKEVITSGEPVLTRYGFSDDDAFAVGLTCGGIIDVFVEPVSRATFPELGDIYEAAERGEPVAVATVISGPGRIGARRVVWGDAGRQSTGRLGAGDRLESAVADDVRGMLSQGLTGIRRYGEHGERLEVALRTPAGYIGVMGSRRTHDDRLEGLRAAGLTEAELARMRSPIGLDLGARTPQETAVSVAAELIQLR